MAIEDILAIKNNAYLGKRFPGEDSQVEAHLTQKEWNKRSTKSLYICRYSRTLRELIK